MSSLHTLAYEVYGDPNGQPVLCVHGGPGAGAYANHARFFDSSHWRIILVDQRGCGASTPRGCLEDNTTQTLIQDFEKLREHLEVDTWVLFGGSWGTTLSLAYAQAHTDRVDGLILRAMCLMRPHEVDWMYRSGAVGVAALQPSAWAAFLEALPQSERGDPLAAWHSRLISADTDVRDKAASAWLRYDMSVGKVPSSQLQSWGGKSWSQTAIGSGATHSLPPLRRQMATEDATAETSSSAAASKGSGTNSGISSGNGSGTGAASSQAAPLHGDSTTKASSPAASGTNATSKGVMTSFVAQAMLTAHYSINSAFLLDEPILKNIDKLRSIPAIGIQGRLDLVCPPATAFEVHQAWPELRLRLVGGAGHSQYDPAIQHELLEATDAMRNRSWCDRSRTADTPQFAVL